MKNLLIYYGYPNSFNSSSNGWDNKKVAEDMAQYQVIVLGDGLQQISHADHANTVSIVSKLKVLNPNILIFGYVTVNQTYANFKTKVNDWKDNVVVHGIFFDEAGYDYGTVATNGRAAFNDKVDYVHSKGLNCFINSWKLSYILGIENDTTYPNTTWNPDLVESNLNNHDIYLFESIAINTQSYTNDYEDKSTWYNRISEIKNYINYGIKFAFSCVINNNHANGQNLYEFAFISALMGRADMFGSSDENYGSSSAAVKKWNKIDITKLYFSEDDPDMVIKNSEVNNNWYLKYLESGKLKLDFTAGSQGSDIDFY